MTRRSLFALAYILPFIRKPEPKPEDVLVMRDRIAPDITKVLASGIRGFRGSLTELLKQTPATASKPTAASREFSEAVGRYSEAIDRLKELPPELL